MKLSLPKLQLQNKRNHLATILLFKEKQKNSLINKNGKSNKLKENKESVPEEKEETEETEEIEDKEEKEDKMMAEEDMRQQADIHLFSSRITVNNFFPRPPVLRAIQNGKGGTFGAGADAKTVHWGPRLPHYR